MRPILKIVARWLLTLLFAASLLAQPPQPPVAEPEEEDAGPAPKEYTFNPIQAQTELRVGKDYMKRGRHKAAALRFEEALKWNPQLAEAALKLGEAREKLHDAKAAGAAYSKYLELAPAAKDAGEIRKRIQRLK